MRVRLVPGGERRSASLVPGGAASAGTAGWGNLRAFSVANSLAGGAAAAAGSCPAGDPD